EYNWNIKGVEIPREMPEIFKSDNPLLEFDKLIEKVIKEDAAQRRIAFLSCATSIFEQEEYNAPMLQPVNITPRGEPGTGKTVLAKIAQFFPNVMEHDNISPEGLFYHGKVSKNNGVVETTNDLRNVIILLTETPTKEFWNRTRALRSRDLFISEKKTVTDDRRASTQKIIGWPVFVTATDVTFYKEADYQRDVIVSPGMSKKKDLAAYELLFNNKDSVLYKKTREAIAWLIAHGNKTVTWPEEIKNAIAQAFLSIRTYFKSYARESVKFLRLLCAGAIINNQVNDNQITPELVLQIAADYKVILNDTLRQGLGQHEKYIKDIQLCALANLLKSKKDEDGKPWFETREDLDYILDSGYETTKENFFLKEGDYIFTITAHQLFKWLNEHGKKITIRSVQDILRFLSETDFIEKNDKERTYKYAIFKKESDPSEIWYRTLVKALSLDEDYAQSGTQEKREHEGCDEVHVPPIEGKINISNNVRNHVLSARDSIFFEEKEFYRGVQDFVVSHTNNSKVEKSEASEDQTGEKIVEYQKTPAKALDNINNTTSGDPPSSSKDLQQIYNAIRYYPPRSTFSIKEDTKIMQRKSCNSDNKILKCGNITLDFFKEICEKLQIDTHNLHIVDRRNKKDLSKHDIAFAYPLHLIHDNIDKVPQNANYIVLEDMDPEWYMDLGYEPKNN
ncbi:MAG: hypothetical protein ACE5J3_09585, partial [Methanosarcinales archaeon]